MDRDGAEKKSSQEYRRKMTASASWTNPWMVLAWLCHPCWRPKDSERGVWNGTPQGSKGELVSALGLKFSRPGN